MTSHGATSVPTCFLKAARTVYIVAHNLAEFEQKCYRTAEVLVCPLGRCHRGSVLPSEPQNFLYIAIVDVHSVHMLRQCTRFAPIVTARRTTCFQQLSRYIPPSFGASDFRSFSSFRLRMALHMLTKTLRKQGEFESTQCNCHRLFAIEDVLWPLTAAVHSHKSKGHPPRGRPCP